jgi:hypothetical protein
MQSIHCHHQANCGSVEPILGAQLTIIGSSMEKARGKKACITCHSKPCIFSVYNMLFLFAHTPGSLFWRSQRRDVGNDQLAAEPASGYLLWVGWTFVGNMASLSSNISILCHMLIILCHRSLERFLSLILGTCIDSDGLFEVVKPLTGLLE